MAKKSKYEKWFEYCYGKRPMTYRQEKKNQRDLGMMEHQVEQLQEKIEECRERMEDVDLWEERMMTAKAAWASSLATLIQEQCDKSLGRGKSCEAT